VGGIEGVHRADDRHVVNDAGELRQQFADLDAAPAIALEFKGRGKKPGRGALGAQIHRFGALSRIFEQGGLGIEHVDLGRPAIQVEHDDMPGLHRQLRSGIMAEPRRRIGREDIRPHAGQADHAEAAANGFDQLPAREFMAHGRNISSLVESRIWA
jgi:hypothetical protein